MKDYKINIANKIIRIINIYDDTYHQCIDYLCEGVEDFTIEITNDDIAYERKQTILEAQYEGITVYPYTEAQLESTATYRKIANKMIKYNTVVFHGAVVAIDNVGYLFTAKSGTGKTTHINLWLKHYKDAYVVNGDKPLLIVSDQGVQVCGSPWAGKEGYNTNTVVNLKAICLLERGTTNTIKPISFKEASMMLLGQTYRPDNQELLVKTINIINNIGKHVSFYKLSCNMEEDAAIVSYEGMQ